MVARVNIILLIALCLMAGMVLILLPWINWMGLSDWGDNYLLVMVSTKSGLPVLRQTVASGWVRGGITALGVLNLVIAFWEIANFNRSVEQLENEVARKPRRDENDSDT